MNTPLQTAPVNEPFPRLLRYCDRCRRETAHEVHVGGDLLVCKACLQRALDYELDRD